MPSGPARTVSGVETSRRSEWRGTIAFGRVQVPVAGAVELTGAGPAAEVAVVACADLDGWPRPAAHLLDWLRPRAGGETAYALLAEALERTRLVALLGGGPGVAHLPLWSFAGSLAVGAETPATAGPETWPGEEELFLARALLRALPRRLPPPAAPEVPPAPLPAPPKTFGGGVVIPLDAVRRRRPA